MGDDTEDEPGRQPPAGPNVVRPFRDTRADKYSSGSAPSQPRARQFRVAPAAQLAAAITAPQWVIRGVIEADTLAVLYGDPAAGKSFIALDMALSVASGLAWHGHETRAGMVVYLCGEGHGAIGRRIRAWSIARDQSLEALPAYVSARPAPLNEGIAAAEVTAALDALADTHGAPHLIVIDTLARHHAGDESSTRDMSALIERIDGLRRRYGAAVLIVHHTGHAAKDRARGSIALRAAVDAEYRAAKELGGPIELASTKMKDAPLPEPMAFILRSVELPIVDDRGEPVTSAVLGPTRFVERRPPGGKHQRAALAVLAELESTRRDQVDMLADGAVVTLTEWLAACRAAGVPAKQIYQVRDSLAASGHIRIGASGRVASS